MTESLEQALADDVAAIARIEAVRTILEVVCRTTGLGFAAVARVTESHWIACAVLDEIGFGLLPGGELEVSTTICDEIRESGELVVIDDALEDPVFCKHPTPEKYGFRSYISVPITLPGGQFFGTLCAIDPKPARVNTAETLGMFKLFASLIAFHLDAQERVSRSEQALLDERQNAELREQFIAVLGHDLRNPLAAIDAGTRALRKLPTDERAGPLLSMILRSTGRMSGLIGNVLDFARGRLGDGLLVHRKPDTDLTAALTHVIDELRAASPGRVIDSELTLDRPVYCDGPRIAQLCSNLLANALSHGDPNGPVRVVAESSPEAFELRVMNRGTPIPPQWMARLFQPFSRASARPGQEGLGLGLYIAAEIARAHGGTLEAISSDEETRFTLRIPAVQ